MPNDREIMKINDVFFRIKIKKMVKKPIFADECKKKGPLSIKRKKP
jgi:hypothetical protein